MLISSKQIVLETKEDVINYITKGEVPKPQDADAVFITLRDPSKSLVNLQYEATNAESIFLADVLEQVYDNVYENQKFYKIACVASGLIGFIIGRSFG